MILTERLVDEWKRELPAQFQDHINIDAIIDAVGGQLTELEDAYEGVRDRTDILTATGKNLDYIGDIVGISRNEAYSLLEITNIDTLTDDVYRSVLYFQILKNNSDSTYENLMKGLHLLWGDKALIRYSENPVTELYNGKAWNDLDPATIKINIDDIESDEPDPTMIKPMVIRAGGVKMLYEVSYRDRIEQTEYEHFRNLMVSYDIYNRYNGDYLYNGEIQYCKVDSRSQAYTLFNGAAQFNGKYMFDAIGKRYRTWDGTYRFDGEIQWGPIEGSEAPDEVDAVILNQAKLKQLKLRAQGGDWQITHFVFGNGDKYTPTGKETDLKSEIYRSEKIMVEQTDERTWTYTGEIPSDQCNGEYISEIGLADQDGELICIKTFDKKLKSTGNPMVFKIDNIVDIVY